MVIGPPTLEQEIRIQVQTISVPDGPDILVGVTDADNARRRRKSPSRSSWCGRRKRKLAPTSSKTSSWKAVTRPRPPAALASWCPTARRLGDSRQGDLSGCRTASSRRRSPTRPTRCVDATREPLPSPRYFRRNRTTESPDGGVHFIRSDLQFILDQIKIAERHSAGEDLDRYHAELAPGPSACARSTARSTIWCLGRSSSARPIKTSRRCSTKSSATTRTGIRSMSMARCPRGLKRQHQLCRHHGDVVDFDPRIISNLVVDQTPNNPAAIAAALASLDRRILRVTPPRSWRPRQAVRR